MRKTGRIIFSVLCFFTWNGFLYSQEENTISEKRLNYVKSYFDGISSALNEYEHLVHFFPIVGKPAVCIWIIDKELDRTDSALAQKQARALYTAQKVFEKIIASCPEMGQILQVYNPMILDSKFAAWLTAVVPLTELVTEQGGIKSGLQETIKNNQGTYRRFSAHNIDYNTSWTLLRKTFTDAGMIDETRINVIYPIAQGETPIIQMFVLLRDSDILNSYDKAAVIDKIYKVGALNLPISYLECFILNRDMRIISHGFIQKDKLSSPNLFDYFRAYE